MCLPCRDSMASVSKSNGHLWCSGHQNRYSLLLQIHIHVIRLTLLTGQLTQPKWVKPSKLTTALVLPRKQRTQSSITYGTLGEVLWLRLLHSSTDKPTALRGAHNTVTKMRSAYLVLRRAVRSARSANVKQATPLHENLSDVPAS